MPARGDQRTTTILERLRKIARRLATIDPEAAALRRERAELMLEARALDPPVTMVELGAAGGLSKDAVADVLRKARARSA